MPQNHPPRELMSAKTKGIDSAANTHQQRLAAARAHARTHSRGENCRSGKPGPSLFAATIQMAWRTNESPALRFHRSDFFVPQWEHSSRWRLPFQALAPSPDLRANCCRRQQRKRGINAMSTRVDRNVSRRFRLRPHDDEDNPSGKRRYQIGARQQRRKSRSAIASRSAVTFVTRLPRLPRGGLRTRSVSEIQSVAERVRPPAEQPTPG
jgi:hypothetical protein